MRTVLSRSSELRRWDFRCDCGKVGVARHQDLKNYPSCGCLTIRSVKERFTKHGQTESKPYMIWGSMRQRCRNPSNKAFHNYGGRGIKICKRWSGFQRFWADMGPTWRKGLTLERINVNGDYKPSNCCWATRKEQAGNRRTERLIATPEGKMSVTKAGERFGLSRKTIFNRIGYGWPEHLLLLPTRRLVP